jgi:glycosyltransferase involved in cell wall biosynthesis
MKIAQVAPLIERVPPDTYGGIERVVSYLTETLIDCGHDVTLFAAGDSITRARLVAPCKRALRLDSSSFATIPHYTLLLELVLQEIEQFDVVHFHVESLHFPVVRRLNAALVTTLHGRLDWPDIQALYSQFKDLPFVSVSNAQRTLLPEMNYCATIHHGLPGDLYSLSTEPDGYLAFLGRISPEKGIATALRAAQVSNTKIKIAAKIDAVDREYFEAQIRPVLTHELVEYIGEIDDAGKQGFLAGARVLLHLGDWPEPFGLTIIEAMACGTPVIAYYHPASSATELIEDGVTGFVVRDFHEILSAINRAENLNRSIIRQTFDRRFTASRMTSDYIGVYKEICSRLRLRSNAGR